ncbi:MAG: DUF4349 domain-containing protein [Peptococcaceae bacterium]|nr:DUF4349 domain-containing protein [Peptococcaceae bacterium]
MKIRVFAILVALVTILCLSACAKAPNESAEYSPVPIEQTDMNDEQMYRNEAPVPAQDIESADNVDTNMGKKIVYTAWATLEVDDVAHSIKNIEAETLSIGGYVAQSEYWGNGTKATIVLKIPIHKYTEFKDGLEAWGNVEELTQSSEDIGLQYYDTEARLKSLEAQEQRYLGILNEAGTVEQILNVEKALSDVRTRIESLKGQLRYWDNQVDYSQLTLTLHHSNTGEGFWAPTPLGTTLETCWNAIAVSLGLAWNMLNYALVVIAFLSPALLVGGLVLVWFFLRRIKKRKAAEALMLKAKKTEEIEKSQKGEQEPTEQQEPTKL